MIAKDGKFIWQSGHDIVEIFLMLALNTNKSINYRYAVEL
jgi:hypothetical protein